jgi:putative membrane protein
MKRGLKWLFLVLGLALFGWFIQRAGLGEILAVVDRLGWWSPLVLVPFFFVCCLDALGWRWAFPAGQRPPYSVLLRVRWAGEAVNNLIPTAYVGGEAVKAWLLHKRGYSSDTATTSVVVSKTLQVAAQVVFIALGAGLALTRLPADSPARQGFALVAALAAVVVVLLFWIQRVGFFSLVRTLSLWLRMRRLEAKQTQLRALDDRIFRFYREHRPSCVLSFLTYLAGWLGDATEVFLVSHLLGFPMDYATALVIESFVTIAKAVGVFVPGALGIQESGVWLLFGLFGFTEPQAVAYALLRRGREVVFTALGAAWLYAEGVSFRHLGERVAGAKGGATASPAPSPARSPWGSERRSPSPSPPPASP